jgi:hypothetical protein
VSSERDHPISSRRRREAEAGITTAGLPASLPKPEARQVREWSRIFRCRDQSRIALRCAQDLRGALRGLNDYPRTCPGPDHADAER